MFNEMSFEQATKNAAHLKALGTTEVYLGRDAVKPWHLATRCEPGGSHRLEIHTDVRFYGEDPATGLTFRWSFDIEPFSANGSSEYHIDVEGCREVLAKVPAAVRQQFRDYLADCAAKVRDKAAEWQRSVDTQNAAASALRDCANAG